MICSVSRSVKHDDPIGPLATTFVGCHAGITNEKIPADKRIPGYCTTHGTLELTSNDSGGTTYWKNKATEEGIKLAEQWMIENEKLARVVIYTKNLAFYGNLDIERGQWPNETAVEIIRSK